MSLKNGLSNTPLWEKLVGLLGSILIFGTILFLLWSAVFEEEGTPEIDFSVHEILSVDARFLILLDVHNSGEFTASDIGLEASLSTEEGNTERVEIRLAYLAAGSTRRVGLYFDTDPNEGSLTVRALGYQKP